jgi:hypothetical protein
VGTESLVKTITGYTQNGLQNVTIVSKYYKAKERTLFYYAYCKFTTKIGRNIWQV